MTSLIVDYLAKSILLFLFDFYFIWNPLVLEGEEEARAREPTYLEELSKYILD
jgi:hypothetical protein